MYTRLINPPLKQSFFLFGPRGTGKSTWIRQLFPAAQYFDLLDSRVYTDLLAHPARIEDRIPDHQKEVIIDEVQKVPALLNEVHRLIESKKIRFILTGSSARKLRRGGANLLAGRAYTRFLFPLTSLELGDDFEVFRALKNGTLPGSVLTESPKDYLHSYMATYLREEIQAEGITRNLATFSRFLESASFSQAQPLNMTKVAEDCLVNRKVVEDYFQILEDLLIAERIPVFSKRAKRKMTAHPKFMFFDVGVFRAIRPRGPMDLEEEIDGPALETLVWQELKALNSYLDFEYQIYFWRTQTKVEVDFVLYGPNGFFAIEVKRSDRVKKDDLVGLKQFLADYPEAKAILLCTGSQNIHDSGIDIISLRHWFGKSGEMMKRIFKRN